MLFFNAKEVHNADTPFDVDNCDIVTFQYCKNKIENTDFFLLKPHLTIVIDLTQSKEKLWQGVNANSHRLINKAKRENMCFHQDEHYDEFYKIYKSFLINKGYATFHGYLGIFGIGAVTKKTMKDYGTLFTTSLNNEVLAGTLALESKTSIHAWIGATKRLTADRAKDKLISRANRFLLWNIMNYAKDKGIKEFDLGGIFTDEEVKKDRQKRGIREFKMQLGGKKVTRYQYQKIYSPSLKRMYRLFAKI